MSELTDTRESLEEAAYSISAKYCGDIYNYHDCACAIICLLDRQAEITKADTSGDYDYIEELHERIEELAHKRSDVEMERDELLQRVQHLEAELNTAELDNEHLREQLRHIGQLERESAYMRLPVDADGVPIRVGDYLQGVYSRFEVCAVSEHYAYWAEGKHFDKADCCRHVQPDTVESLLDEMLEEARCKFHEDGSCEMGVTYGRRAEYAERIRKAVEQ